MQPCREITIKANGLSFAAKMWGAVDKPPILALHGWMDNAGTFDELAPLLSDYQICAVDMAGHGLSDHRAPGAHYYMSDYVCDAIAMADSLNWQSFTLLGHSLGANVSLMLAGTFPERIDKLLLIEGFGSPSRNPVAAPNELRSAIIKMGVYKPDRQPVYDDYEKVISKRMDGATKVNRRASEMLCKRGIKEVPGGWSWRSDPRLRYSSPLRFSEEEVWAFIANVSAPTLLITGEQGLPLELMGFSSRQAKHTDLLLECIPGRHHLHLEGEAGAVAELMNKFLNKDEVNETMA